MTRRLGWGGTIAILLLLAFAAIVAGLAIGWAALPLEHTTISVDGRTFSLADIDAWDVAPVIAAIGVAVMVALVVGGLAVVFALLAAALSILVALVAVVATLALVASPALLLVWAIWRLARPAAGPRPAAA
ncbi:MAG: hypothetical protein ACXWCV_07860 [Caldimonas sp.]